MKQFQDVHKLCLLFTKPAVFPRKQRENFIFQGAFNPGQRIVAEPILESGPRIPRNPLAYSAHVGEKIAQLKRNLCDKFSKFAAIAVVLGSAF